ncbi:hypothetical protein [Aeromonas media]|uniref:hypothetical protein n=1 Tax=Aeromonas media TaxID=651 RepID=UPI003D00AD4F
MALLTLCLPLGGLEGESIPCLPSAWVIHPNFGGGNWLNSKEINQQSREYLQFDEVGAKWLVTAYTSFGSAVTFIVF